MKLKRGLGLIHIFCIASGAMISSGLFILPGLAHARADLVTEMRALKHPHGAGAAAEPGIEF